MIDAVARIEAFLDVDNLNMLHENAVETSNVDDVESSIATPHEEDDSTVGHHSEIIIKSTYRMKTALFMLQFSATIGDYMMSVEGKRVHEIMSLLEDLDDDDLTDLHDEYSEVFLN